jgi:1-deoxy-D-xylulose-5-phosphate reductoisomerase
VKVATHPEVDFVVSAIVGVAGLEATYEAVKAGKVVGLANKECLGRRWRAHHRRSPRATTMALLPIDSEHNAVHQCLRGGRHGGSGTHLAHGIGRPVSERRRAPNSRSITVRSRRSIIPPGRWESASPSTPPRMMNKGFEVIEACRLFHLPPAKVGSLVHPQSTIHSMVEFIDGSILGSVFGDRHALTDPVRINIS